jgi:hypothetical protein
MGLALAGCIRFGRYEVVLGRLSGGRRRRLRLDDREWSSGCPTPPIC